MTKRTKSKQTQTLSWRFLSLSQLKPSLTEQVQSLTSQAAAKALREAGIVNDSPAACKDSVQQPDLPFQTTNAVHDFLRRCGAMHPERVNPCLKAGLLNGNVNLKTLRYLCQIGHARSGSSARLYRWCRRSNQLSSSGTHVRVYLWREAHVPRVVVHDKISLQTTE